MKITAVFVLVMVVLVPFLFSFGVSEEEEGFTYDKYASAESYEAESDASYDEGDIKSVVIHWRSGDVTITEGEDIAVSVRESVTGVSDEEKMHFLVKDGVLYVEFCESGYRFTRKNCKKPLSVEIPRGLSLSVIATDGNISLNAFHGRSLELQTISGAIQSGEIITDRDVSILSITGDILLSSLSCRKAELSVSSGNVEVESVECDRAEFSLTSGNLTADSIRTGKTSVSSTSGNISLSGESSSLSVSSVSGNITSSSLDAGDTAEISTTSGKVSLSSFSALTMDLSSSSGDVTIDSLSVSSFSLDATSGDVSLSLETPVDGKINTTSGSVTITPVPEDTVIKFSSVNGKLSYSGLLEYADDVFSVGSGSHLVTVSTTSGNLEID